jgi:UDP-N-acetylglucosamine--N-acetylmuramyl-(pentapeptide) pyrophosphoryl-undecaprenol N-acetylglucosamine transferase
MNKVIGQVFCLEKEENLPFQHIHATGNYGWEWMPEYVKSLGLDLNDCPGLDMKEYIYNMPTVMAAADVIIGRAGASSCNEIAAAGTPCILIPSPNVTNHHQEKNAQVYADQGAAVLIPEQECTARHLYDEIKALIADEKRRADMKAALQKTVVPDSAEQICGIIEELAKH